MMAKDRTQQMIEDVFTFHPATPVTGPKHDEVRKAAKAFAKKLVKLTGEPSPEQTLMLRGVQTAMMYANADIAIKGAQGDG